MFQAKPNLLRVRLEIIQVQPKQESAEASGFLETAGLPNASNKLATYNNFNASELNPVQVNL